MKENNGIIAGILMACFPGAMRLFSLLPRHYFFIIAGLAAILSVVLYFYNKKYKRGWLYCLPVVAISLLIGIFMYPKVSEDAINVVVRSGSVIPQKLIDRADAGDLDAQEEVLTLWVQSESKSAHDGNIVRVRKYATQAAENNSSLGFMVSGFLKENGFGGEKYRNQAISDYLKAIELAPTRIESYQLLLAVDALTETHPDLYADYNRRYDELKTDIVDSKNRCIDSLLTLLYGANLSKEELISFLDMNSCIIHEVLPQSLSLQTALFFVLIELGCTERITEYESCVTDNADLKVLAIMPHLPNWELNTYSRNIDSLITMLPERMLNTVQAYSDVLRFDNYSKAAVNLEVLYRKYLSGKITSHQYKDEIECIKGRVYAEVQKMSRAITRHRSGYLQEPVDSIFAIRFKQDIEIDHNGDVFNSMVSWDKKLLVYVNENNKY